MPKSRIILIDEHYTVFTEPDFKAINNSLIFDVKIFNTN